MKKFLKEIMNICFFTILFGEFICRLFPITADIPIKENNDGFYKLKKHQSGTYIKGKFPKFIRAKYNINNLGFNSSKDYYFDDFDKKKIGIIGDSFVEGFQVDVNNSIGRQLEKSNLNLSVYEFGLSGNNFLNYENIYNQYDLKEFDCVFIIMDYDDVLANSPEKQIFNNTLKIKESLFRVFYENFYFFKYLNFNHGIIRKLRNIVYGNQMENKNELNHIKTYDISNFYFKHSNLSLLMKSKNDTVLKSIYPSILFYPINEKYNPINFGFDKHWNLNGRKNVTETILELIK